MTAQMLIGTRFGIGVRDPAWFEHRLVLLSAITAPSMLAQEDQTFHWALFVDSSLPTDVHRRLEVILEPFEGRAFVYVDLRQGAGTAMPLAQERNIVDTGGYLLTARIDDDDAWHVGTVAAVRDRVMSWRQRQDGSPGLGLTFENGLEWIMYDMLDIELLQDKGEVVTKCAAVRPFPHTFHSMSVFLYSRPLEDDISALSVPHSRTADALTSKGLAAEIVRTEHPMWLYCRHKQTVSEAGTRHHTDKGMLDKSLADLAREFGIDEIRTAKYLNDAESYGYCLEKNNEHLRISLARELEQVQTKLKSSAVDSDELCRLRQKETKLLKNMGKIAENVIGNPAQMPTDLSS